MITSPYFASALKSRVCTTLLRVAVAFTASAAVSRSLAVSEPSALNGQNQSYAYSWQQEVQQGADADKEITQQMGLYDNPDVQNYVQAVGRRVLAASTFAQSGTPEMYRNTNFTFRVLDSPVVNAFALPGGYVYVTRGLLTHVDNEAQLAVVLGHEIGHVAARHSSQQARRSQWSQIGVIAGAILGQAVLGDRMPNFAEQVMSTGSKALGVFLTKYSREAENEADTLGVGYALNAGYAADQSARFFDALRRLAAQEGQGLPTWMSTHPDPGNRADHVVALTRERQQSGPAERKIGQDEYLRHIDGMIVGDDPRQGFTRNGVFYHPTLHFQLPVVANWKVDNQPTAVMFSEPNGRAMMGLRMAPANRTHDAAAQFVSENKVQVSATGDTTVNGLPTTVVVGKATSSQGQVGVWDAFIELDGKVYSLLGYAPAQSFEQMRPTFESVAGGFSPLRDPRLASVQPAHLRIVKTDHAAPFASYVPTSLPPDFSAESVAILNQVGLNEKVPANAALKIPDGGSVATPNGEVLATVPDASYPGSRDTAGAYPPPRSTSSTYPQSSYPQPSYPQSSYPNSSYPNGNYPNAGQANSRYPGAPGYPGDSNYPSRSGYPDYPNQAPASSSNYPGDNRTDPAASYPSQPGYPASNYPAGNSYPDYPTQNPGYPAGSSTSAPNGTSYPQTQYPQTQYPQTQYPQTQYPQSQYPQTQYPPAQSSQTAPRSYPPAAPSQPQWPR